MLSNDEAITIGVRKYREHYPEGALALSLEAKAVLGAFPGRHQTTVQVTFGIKDQREPFVLFRVVVDRATGETCVETANDWRVLLEKEFDDGKTVQH